MAMERRTIGGWVIGVDRQRTAAAHAVLRAPSCTCIVCRNFCQAMGRFSPTVQTFFRSLGMDVEHPTEIWEGFELRDGWMLYHGFYTLVGRCDAVPLCPLQEEVPPPVSGMRRLLARLLRVPLLPIERDRREWFDVEERFSLAFSSRVGLLPAEEFPEPALQMDVLAALGAGGTL